MTKKILVAVLLQFVTLGCAQNSPLETERGSAPPPPALVHDETVKIPSDYSGEILEKTSEPAEFPGGINAFRTKLLNIFNTETVIGQGRVSAECSFVIERDGSMSQIKVKGNNESMNKQAQTALNALAKEAVWEPAKHKGTPVRYRLRLPITLILD